MAALTAPRRALEEALSSLELPADVETLGPLSADETAMRYLLRAPLEQGPALSDALTSLRGMRSAHKEAVTVTVRVDPPDIGS